MSPYSTHDPFDGRVIDSLRKSIDKKEPQVVAETIRDSLDFLCRKTAGTDPLSRVGVSQPGIVGSDGVIRLDIRHKWTEVPMKEILQKMIPVPVFVSEEANTSLLAEIEFGSIEELDSLLYLFIAGNDDSGVSGAFVIKGSIVTGADGFAGEFGHIVLDPQGPQCYCGRKGCWETVTDLQDLMHRYSEKTGCGDFERTGDFLDFLKANPEIADKDSLLDEYTEYHAQGLINLIHIFNPEKIVIGGGITVLGDIFLERLKDKVLKKSMKPFSERLKISLSRVGERNGFLGSLSIILGHAVELGQQNFKAKNKSQNISGGN